MKKARIYAIVLSALLSVLFFHTLSYASVGRFTAVEGRVDILRPGERRAVAVREGDEVSPGDAVRTKKNSFAEIVFNDETRLRLAANTRVVIKDYTLSESNERKGATLRLLRGKIRATVPKVFGGIIPVSGRSNFEVETPTAVAGVRGTDFFMFYSLALTGLAVEDGTVEAFNAAFPAIVQRVRGGQMVVISSERPAPLPSFARGFEFVRFTRDTSPGREGGERGMEGLPEGLGGESVFLPETYEGERAEEGETGLHAGEYVNIPVTEVETALLGVDERAFTGNMAGSAGISLALASNVSGDWGESGTFSMSITNGTFTDTCLAGCSYSWTGTIAGTNNDGTVFAGTITGGAWGNGSWNAGIIGTTFNGTETFNGSISGTYSGTSSGTFSGTGSGRVN